MNRKILKKLYLFLAHLSPRTLYCRMTRVCVRWEVVSVLLTPWTPVPAPAPYHPQQTLSPWLTRNQSTGAALHTMNSTAEWERCITHKTIVLSWMDSPTLPITTTTASVLDYCPTSIETLP